MFEYIIRTTWELRAFKKYFPDKLLHLGRLHPPGDVEIHGGCDIAHDLAGVWPVHRQSGRPQSHSTPDVDILVASVPPVGRGECPVQLFQAEVLGQKAQETRGIFLPQPGCHGNSADGRRDAVHADFQAKTVCIFNFSQVCNTYMVISSKLSTKKATALHYLHNKYFLIGMTW